MNLYKAVLSRSWAICLVSTMASSHQEAFQEDENGYRSAWGPGKVERDGRVTLTQASSYLENPFFLWCLLSMYCVPGTVSHAVEIMGQTKPGPSSCFSGPSDPVGRNRHHLYNSSLGLTTERGARKHVVRVTEREGQRQLLRGVTQVET